MVVIIRYFQSIFGVALYSLLVAWILTLILPIQLDHTLWVVLGTMLIVRYAYQFHTLNPETRIQSSLTEIIISIFVSSFIIAISATSAWLLFKIITVDLTIFQAFLLFDLALTFGLFFNLKSDTSELYHLNCPLNPNLYDKDDNDDEDNDDDDDDDDDEEEEEKEVKPLYIPHKKPINPSKKTNRRRK